MTVSSSSRGIRSIVARHVLHGDVDHRAAQVDAKSLVDELEASFGDRPAPARPSGDEWVEWSGGECPVPRGTEGLLRVRDGEVVYSLSIDKFNFEHGPEGPFDGREIVAYRVLSSSTKVVDRKVEDQTRLDLGNLLALVHNDGGNFELEHGTAKAVAEAMEIVEALHSGLHVDEDLPSGFVVVPRKPTVTMRLAGAEVHGQQPREVVETYDAMLAVTPRVRARRSITTVKARKAGAGGS